ncbi:golgin-45 [Asbolus verrucosus]|uniref:Golgin-45 n=1 Tax=Asbolus verrucosus TaxID=1661398 RepID=A0A482VLG5_ASBVE|nr:golgin-45 [Asbolus verrucosus]
MLKERTLGDGIDNSLLKLTESDLHKKYIKMNIKENTNVVTFKPIEPKSRVFHLKPVYVPKDRKQLKCLIRKPKEPKFVPYEPYKGAVEPILAHKPPTKRNVALKSSKNNVDIQDLVAQMSEIRTTELNKLNQDVQHSDESFISMKQWEENKLAYETDIQNLRETNSHLENQLKFQAQVNSELKTLLVAAVGEDLETRVQHLTEDKLQLARALLNSANHLTSHQEQTEWLSGQCEVWRSKFLASSLMVEELARWKSALSARINELQESVRKLLDERYKIHKKSLRTCCLLQEVKSQLDIDKGEQCESLKTCNIVDLSNLNCSTSRQIGDLVHVDVDKCDKSFERYSQLPQHTASEKIGMRLLQNPVTISSKQDAVCKALMGNAMLLGGEQMYLKYPSNQATCCAHCTGEIKNI